MPLRLDRIVPTLTALVFLAGCSSFAKGVTEAILETGEKEDTRQCHVEGPVSVGLSYYLESQDRSRSAVDGTRELKILMVHGIGRHSPGYSGRLTEHLMPVLGLTIKSKSRKEFILWEPTVSKEPVGQLSVQLYTNPDRTRRLVFYELTWSDVIEEERRALAFDNSAEYSFRRTELNGFLKRFFNDRVPDAFIYLSSSRAKIFASVQQSFCWMTSGEWETLPNRASERCNIQNPDRARIARQDDFAFLTHSLGSRIAIDVLQDETSYAHRSEGDTRRALAEVFREREIPVYMLANQLPLLGLSIEPPSVRGQTDAYCTADGALADQRALKKLSIYAFSDPNDMLSYAIPSDLLDRYVDSRLCPSVTNISINVAQLVDFFGVTKVANPGAAHSNYDHDERVIEIIAHGVSQSVTSRILRERCSWVETVDID